jgi:hypothetical protein
VIPYQREKPATESGGLYSHAVFYAVFYAAFFPAFSFAHLFRCAAAIFLRADAGIVRFAGAEAVTAAGCDTLRLFAHRAFWARLIFLRASADNVR